LLAPIAASGDKLTITQSTPRCREALPSDELMVVAGPAQKPATPTLLPPCPNAVDLYAAGLEPDALVTVSFMGDEFRAMVPPGQTTFTFRIARLTAGGTVRIFQEKCGLKSDTMTIRVTTGDGPFFAPDLVEPLFGCARVVRAAAKPGTWLQVWGDRGTGPAPISDQVYATGSMRIYVTPYLSEKQDVWLASLECGSSSWTRSPSHEVQKTPDIGSPEIVVPLVDGAMTVTVDAIPGAWVDVYSLSSTPLKVERIGAGVVDPKGRAVPLWRPVTTKELIYVMQSLCDRTSRPSGMHRAIPAVTAFHLGLPIKRLSNQNHMKPLICLSATVVCRHSGGWEYTAELENQETEADCDFDLQFDLIGPSPAFGKPLQGQLSAAGDGSVTQIGYRIHGVPPKRSFAITGHFAGFQDPAYWQTVYEGAHRFDLTNVAWRDYKGTPEAPDTEDPPEKGTKK
jgi:hypothetical protein